MRGESISAIIVFRSFSKHFTSKSRVSKSKCGFYFLFKTNQTRFFKLKSTTPLVSQQGFDRTRGF